MEGVQGVAGDMDVQALALGYRGLAGGADHQGLVAAGQAHMKVALGAGGLEELQGGRKGQVGGTGGLEAQRVGANADDAGARRQVVEQGAMDRRARAAQ